MEESVESIIYCLSGASFKRPDVGGRSVAENVNLPVPLCQ